VAELEIYAILLHGGFVAIKQSFSQSPKLLPMVVTIVSSVRYAFTNAYHLHNTLTVGDTLGFRVGYNVGGNVGTFVGKRVGNKVGLLVGDKVGIRVGQL
jgi:hypothetical protein